MSIFFFVKFEQNNLLICNKTLTETCVFKIKDKEGLGIVIDFMVKWNKLKKVE